MLLEMAASRYTAETLIIKRNTIRRLKEKYAYINAICLRSGAGFFTVGNPYISLGAPTRRPAGSIKFSGKPEDVSTLKIYVSGL
jgi:hypothetical protein